MTPNRISDEDAAEIRSLIETYASLLVQGDRDNWLNLFTDNASFLPPNAAALLGKEEIAGYVADYPDLSTFDASPQDISGSDGYAASSGRYSLSFVDPEGSTVTETGKFIWLWERSQVTAGRFPMISGTPIRDAVVVNSA